jgi:hypothetical protein
LTLRPVRSGSPLRKEQGVWVFRSGKRISAAATGQVLQEQREAHERQNRGRVL